MSQDTDTGGTGQQDRAPRPTGLHATGPHPGRPYPTGQFPSGPYVTGPHPSGPFPGGRPYPPGPAIPRQAGPMPTGQFPAGQFPGGPAWSPLDDADDPRPPGNPAAASSVVLGVIALLVGLRPLAFGSMSLSWDTYVALGLGVLALGVGIVGTRGPVRRPVAAAGIVLALAALIVVAVLPTF